MDRPFPPTKRRIERALSEGNVPVSGFAVRGAALSAALLMAPAAWKALSARFSALLQDAARAPEQASLSTLTEDVAALTFPILATIAAAAVTAGAIQTGGRAHWSRPRDDAGWGPRMLDAIRGVAVAAVLGVALCAFLYASGRELRDATAPATSLAASSSLFVRAAGLLGAAIAVIAVLDVIATRAVWLSGLRMSRSDVLEERRLSEAPLVVSRARQRTYEEIVRGPAPR